MLTPVERKKFKEKEFQNTFKTKYTEHLNFHKPIIEAINKKLDKLSFTNKQNFKTIKSHFTRPSVIDSLQRSIDKEIEAINRLQDKDIEISNERMSWRDNYFKIYIALSSIFLKIFGKYLKTSITGEPGLSDELWNKFIPWDISFDNSIALAE